MLVIEVSGPKLPRIVHWGADLGDVSAQALVDALRPATPLAATNDPVTLTRVPAQADGWVGRPGLTGHRDGAWPYLRLALTEPVTVIDGRLDVRATDAEAGVVLETSLELSPEGVLLLR